MKFKVVEGLGTILQPLLIKGRTFKLPPWSLWLRLNYYTSKMRGHRQQWISHQMNNRRPWQLKKLKSWGPFWSYQLNSTANPAHLPQNWAKLTVLCSWQLQNGPQDFDFFNCHECRLFILCEIHCYFCPHIFWVYYFSLSQCDWLRPYGMKCRNVTIPKLELEAARRCFSRQTTKSIPSTQSFNTFVSRISRQKFWQFAEL